MTTSRTLIIEHPEDRAARLAIEEADTRLDRWKERTTHGLALAIVAVGVPAVAIQCLWYAVGGNGSEADQRWATAILAGMAAWPIGYLTNKHQGR